VQGRSISSWFDPPEYECGLIEHTPWHSDHKYVKCMRDVGDDDMEKIHKIIKLCFLSFIFHANKDNNHHNNNEIGIYIIKRTCTSPEFFGSLPSPATDVVQQNNHLGLVKIYDPLSLLLCDNLKHKHSIIFKSNCEIDSMFLIFRLRTTITILNECSVFGFFFFEREGWDSFIHFLLYLPN
jgi:hypothetical protein